MVDLPIRNASLIDARAGIDVAVSAGQIVAVEAAIGAEASKAAPIRVLRPKLMTYECRPQPLGPGQQDSFHHPHHDCDRQR